MPPGPSRQHRRTWTRTPWRSAPRRIVAGFVLTRGAETSTRCPRGVHPRVRAPRVRPRERAASWASCMAPSAASFPEAASAAVASAEATWCAASWTRFHPGNAGDNPWCGVHGAERATRTALSFPHATWLTPDNLFMTVLFLTHSSETWGFSSTLRCESSTPSSKCRHTSEFPGIAQTRSPQSQ